MRIHESLILLFSALKLVSNKATLLLAIPDDSIGPRLSAYWNNIDVLGFKMLKLSDIVTRDETICSLNFCWNQYSLLCDTFITLFHIEKATKQCKCVLRKKACTIFPKTPWSFLFRKIRSFSWLDGEGLGNFWRRNTVCWWYGCCGFPQDSCFQVIAILKLVDYDGNTRVHQIWFDQYMYLS